MFIISVLETKMPTFKLATIKALYETYKRLNYKFVLDFPFIWKAGTQRENLSHPRVPSPKCLQQPGLDQAKARNPELNPGPQRVVGIQVLEPSSAVLQVCINKKLELEAEPGLKPRYSNLE